MRTYRREHYKLKSYEDGEQCMIEVTEDDKTSYTEYGSEKELYNQAKKLVREGKSVELWNLKYEFIS